MAGRQRQLPPARPKENTLGWFLFLPGEPVRFTITHHVDVPSPQKATALRDKCATYLTDEEQITVITSSMAQETKSFRVRGVDVQGKKPFDRRVEAKSLEEAKRSVESNTMIVAAVDPA